MDYIMRIFGPLVLTLCLFDSASEAQPFPATIVARPLVIGGPSAIDAAGNVYTTGGGLASQFAVTPGAAQTQPGGGTCIGSNGLLPVSVPCTDVYLSKVDATGSAVYGTLLGGQTNDSGTALAVDSAGSVYVTGTTSGSFPTTSTAAISTSTSSAAFIAKLSSDGSRFIYSTYLPPSISIPSAVAVDAQGNAYVAGMTTLGHAFVTKVSADGSTFNYTTILAGTNQEAARAVTVNAAGNVIIVGWTRSADFPVSEGALQPHLAGTQNVFLSELDVTGRILSSTYLGGSTSDAANAVRVDSSGNVYVAGLATSVDFPTTAGSFEPNPTVPLWNSSPGGFLTKLAPDLSKLVYSTYVMNLDSVSPGVTLLALNGSGEAYVAGSIGAGLPVTTSAPQPCFSGSTDAYVAHFSSAGTLLDATYISGTGGIVPARLTFGLSVATDGSVSLAWSPGTAPQLSQIRFGGQGWTAPSCISPDILNSATFTGGQVSPGEFVTLTGLGIGPNNGVTYEPDAEGNLPTTLGGVQVLFNGVPAPLVYVQSQQVNALAPFELSGSATTTVTLKYNAAVFGPVILPVGLGPPGLFRLQPGVSAQAAAVNQDGSLNGPLHPASPGSTVAIWGTGFAPLSAPCRSGAVNPSTAVSLAQGFAVAIDAGGSLSTVSYAGSAPTLLCGVVQINMKVPAEWVSGIYLLRPWSVVSLQNGTATSESLIGSTIFVK
jgi:uncharacterized protein (TIGR03437 family)